MPGRVMAPRDRIAVLSLVTIAIVRKGTCTPKNLAILTGCWVHVLFFRRIMFSVLDQVFREGLDKPSDEVFCLSRQARSELQLIAALAPLAQSNLRAKYSNELFCTDASPAGGAVTSTKISSFMTQELWRHSEQRGFYTKLLSPAAEILHEKGMQVEADKINPKGYLESLNSTDLVASFGVPPPLSEGILYDCVEFFRGTGGWSSAHAQLGLRVHDGFDIDSRRLRFGDISNNSTCHELISLALRRVVLAWHAGIPCVTFGTLRRPHLRSCAQPAGFDPDDPMTAYHNQLARRTAFILTIALHFG